MIKVEINPPSKQYDWMNSRNIASGVFFVAEEVQARSVQFGTACPDTVFVKQPTFILQITPKGAAHYILYEDLEFLNVRFVKDMTISAVTF